MASSRLSGRPRAKFRVGDHVAFPFGSSSQQGIITEDRDCIGVGGRRLYQISFEFEGESRLIELGEKDFEFVPVVMTDS